MRKLLIIILLLAGLRGAAQNRRSELVKDTSSAPAGTRKAYLVKNAASDPTTKRKGDLRKDLPELFITSDGRSITTSDDKKIIKQ